MAEITQHRVELNGVDFAYLSCGEGPLALCLHGFPDTPNGWRPLMTALADAGYHAVAPWMRGYAPTAVPADGGSPLAAWIDDATTFHEVFGGGEPGVLIGHDWGAITTYAAAAYAPERWSRIVTASVPPTSVMGTRMMDYDQVKAFWYQYVFLQPTAEAIVSANDLEFIARIWADWSPGYDASADLGAVKDALREPPHLTAALHTYRSLYDFSLQPPELVDRMAAMVMPHPQPTLYLHGTNDGCIVGDVYREALAVLPEGSSGCEVIGAGHFVHYEQPQVVVDAVLAFLTS